MPAIHQNGITRRDVRSAAAATFVVMVGDDPCTVRAAGVRPIADVLAPPEAELLGSEEMEALGLLDAIPTAVGEGTGDGAGGMIAAPRLRRRRQRALASRATFFRTARA